MLRQASLVVGCMAVLLVSYALPAFADGWGSVDCSQSPTPACQLGAGTSGNARHGEAGPGHDRARHDSGGGRPGTDTGSGGDTIVGSKNNLANCEYVRSDYQPPSGVTPAAYLSRPHADITSVHSVMFTAASAPPSTAPTDSTQGSREAGAWYVYRCSSNGFHDALFRPPVWIPDAQRPGVAAVPSPAELAQLAHNQLRLPEPKIQASPREEQLVSLPTWLWLDRNGWGKQSATASVPGVSVTAVARPTAVSWWMGDGDSVVCRGPGSPFPTGADPKLSSPDCGYTYRVSSAAQASGAFPVTATVHWRVTWVGAGQSGVFPDMTTSANTLFRVAESQALNTGVG